MKILAIETATQACSCALTNEELCYVRHRVEPRKHAELILHMVDEVLEEAGLVLGHLDALAFGRGPGSFTGVRIAAGVIQGLALGADRRVAPVSTLQALAQGVFREEGHTRVLAALDARMDEVYWGAFEVQNGLMRPITEESVCAPAQVTDAFAGRDFVGAGSGWASYEGLLASALGRTRVALAAGCLPQALDVAHLAAPRVQADQLVAPEHALPVYLRDRVTR